MLVKLSFLKGFLSVFFEYPWYYFEQMSISGTYRPLDGKISNLFTALKIASTHLSAAMGLSLAIYWAISDTRSIAKGDQIIFIWKFAQ